MSNPPPIPPTAAPAPGLRPGVFLTVGQMFTVTADVLDTCSLGSVDPGCNRVGNADGLANCPDYSSYTSGGLTAPYGTLVGQIAGGNYFVVGMNFSGAAGASGELLLFNFASNTSDNSGSIRATISIVPVPAAGLLLLGALGGIAALRRRKTA